jgi:alanine dehydrogenase
MSTLLLTQSEVRQLLEMPTAIRAVQAAFLAHGTGATRMPAKVYLDFPEHQGDLRAMPAWMEGAAGLKWVNSHPHNPTRHQLPSVMGLYVLSDPATALPIAVLDATLLTAYRTGAAAAVASRFLAHRSSTLGIVGCGVQADYLVEAHRVVYPHIQVVAADVCKASAAGVAERWKGTVGSVQQAAGCDIVCTATPSRKPVVQRGWVAPGAHINAMGADAEGKQELDPALLLSARVFVDDWEQASHSGELNVPLARGILSKEDIAGSVCGVVAGTEEGRTDPSQTTIFDSTGLAIQDLALARELASRAQAQGAGRTVDFLA